VPENGEREEIKILKGEYGLLNKSENKQMTTQYK
jgi:hypothetical protein